MKNAISLLVSSIIFLIIILNIDVIGERVKQIFTSNREIIINSSNDYKRNFTYKFVKQLDKKEDYEPHSYEDLLNIFYSTLNEGWDEFEFYCPTDYLYCLEDVSKISYDQVLLSNINNFVNPYNSYSTIKTLYDDTGAVTIKITHLYNKDEIEKLDNDINKLIDENVNDEMDTKEKIRAIHDYIINNTKYDQQRGNGNESEYDSSRIGGVLYDHYSICSGYADTMAVILDKLNIPNFKISSANHVWNAVYLDNKWYHLDLTWDDPIMASGEEVLDHSYFLIDSQKLNELNRDDKEHDFDENVYLEFTEN